MKGGYWRSWRQSRGRIGGGDGYSSCRLVLEVAVVVPGRLTTFPLVAGDLLRGWVSSLFRFVLGGSKFCLEIGNVRMDGSSRSSSLYVG